MINVFIDESGQISNKDGKKYYVIGAVVVNDVKIFNKRIKSWKYNKFPKRIRYLEEVKYRNRYFSSALKVRSLEYLKDNTSYLVYRILEKTDNSSRHGVVKIYTKLIIEILTEVSKIYSGDINLIIDKLGFEKKLTKEINNIYNINIIFERSHLSYGIQMADWYAGAISDYYNNSDTLFQFLTKNSSIAGDEVA